MQNRYVQKHINVKDENVREIRDAATRNATRHLLPNVIQRENDVVRLDAAWRAKIRQQIAQCADDARFWRRGAWRVIPPENSVPTATSSACRARAVSYMAVARRLQGLLACLGIFWFVWFFQQPKRDDLCALRWAPEVKKIQPTRGCHR
jgi:hypothetical protein